MLVESRILFNHFSTTAFLPEEADGATALIALCFWTDRSKARPVHTVSLPVQCVHLLLPSRASSGQQFYHLF